jgi:hypothetical protein
VHDISRVQLDAGSGLPRFNMPLELGLFLGAQTYGSRDQKAKRSLILDTERYRYQVFCSDIAGQDIRAHNDSPARAVDAVRQLLATALDGAARVPGTQAILARYTEFCFELPLLCDALNIDSTELQFVELRSLIATWLARRPLGSFAAAGVPWDEEMPLELAPFSFSFHGPAPGR